ncbi:MAG: DUF763 domain-containing protein, partial [Acidobacteriota bacterium]
MRARTGTAQLPLHTGKAPRWLFSRMVLLAREISTHIVSEFGPEEMLRADVNPQGLRKILLTTYDRAPENFESLLGMKGVGARTLRVLALVSEIIYGTPASTRDP